MSETGKAVRLEIGRTLNALLDEPVLVEVVNSGTVATSLTDALRLKSARFTPQAFMDWHVRETDGSAAAPDGDRVWARMLTPSSGLLAVSPDLSGNLANNDTLELWSPEGPDSDDIDRARDRALSQACTRWRLVPLSWATNSDFLLGTDSTVTDWTATNSSIKRTAETGLFRFTEYVAFVNNSASSGYMYQTIKVRPAETWTFFAIGREKTTTLEAAFTVYDATNSADITLSADNDRTTIEAMLYQIVRGTFTIPSDCEEIQVRLGGASLLSDSYWAALCIYPQDARHFALPARILNTPFVGQFYQIIGSDWPEERAVPLAEQPQLVQVGGGYVEARFTSPIGGKAVFFEDLAHYAALQTAYNTAAGRQTGDAATTDCPLEYIKWATLNELYPGRFDREFREAHAAYGARHPIRVVEAAPGPAYA